MVSIGIHIHPESLCFAELALEKGAPQLLSVGERFFEKPDSEKEKLSLISFMAKELAEKHKGKSLRFCYGLPQNLVSSFFIELPFKEKFKILKTLPFEIEDKTPFRSDKVFFDARICGIRKNHSSVLCFVTPEDNVSEFRKFSKKLSAPPYLLSCEGAALSNLLETWNQPLSKAQNPNKSHSFYIYLGLRNSQMFFYKKGFLSHISVLDWSAGPIIQEMKKLYRLSAQKAWEEFFEKSFILTENRGGTKEQVFFSNMIKKHIQQLIPSLKLLRMSIETEQKQAITKAVIFGPGSVIKNLSAFLTDQIALPVSRLKSLSPFPNLKIEEQAPAFEAIGLALEGLKSSPYQGLNFFHSLKKEAFSLYLGKWQKVGFALLAGLLIFGLYAFVRQQESLKVLDKAQSVFLEYGKTIAFMSESKISVDSMKSFLDKERSKMKSEQIVRDELRRPHPMDQLKKIVQRTGPASAWDLRILYLHLKGQQVELRGQIRSGSLNRFKLRLQNMAEGPIKEDKSFQKQGEGKQPALRSEEPAETDIEPKNQGINVKAGTVEPVPETEEPVFFSYSFSLKEEL